MAKEKKMKKDSTKEKVSKGKSKGEAASGKNKISGKKHSKGKLKSNTPSRGKKKELSKKEVKEFLRQFEENLPSHDVAFIDVGCGVYSIDASATVIAYTADPGNRATPRTLKNRERRLLIDHALGKMETRSKE